MFLRAYFKQFPITKHKTSVQNVSKHCVVCPSNVKLQIEIMYWDYYYHLKMISLIREFEYQIVRMLRFALFGLSVELLLTRLLTVKPSIEIERWRISTKLCFQISWKCRGFYLWMLSFLSITINIKRAEESL